MGDLAPRPNRTPRRQREQRAFTLVVVGGSAAAIAVVGLILAAVGIVGAGIPLLAALVAVACYFLFRRAVGR